MCGITGIFNFGTREPVDQVALKRMVASLRHRGPDSAGMHVDADLGIGMRRLSVIDVAGGSQPMTGETPGIHVVCNGEIYNFTDLRRELTTRGHAFRTRSDTEVVVHAYEQWGLPALSRLNGMFGLAVWDAPKRQLVLARDPFGIKPLYYWVGGGALVFGSEIRALITSGMVRCQVDSVAMDQFMALKYVPAPRTGFAGVGKLLPGHALIVDAGGVRVRRFSLGPPDETVAASEAEIGEQLRDLLVAAVRRQMVADVPVGLLLSGGVDSSAVGWAMTAHGNHVVEAFTVGFEGRFRDNELADASAAARILGAEHHSCLLNPDQYLEFLPESIACLEEPIATSSTLALQCLCRLARSRVTVALSGQGADEPFAGYHRCLGERYAHAYQALPRAVRHGLVEPLAGALPRNERLKRAVRTLGIPGVADRLSASYSAVGYDLRRDLYVDEEMAAHDFVDCYEWCRKDVAERDGLSQMLYVDARTSLADNLLLLSDKVSMASSLEVRVPFLDLELMRFVESIPSQLKIRGLKGKYILRRALAGQLPSETLKRRKIGFADPTSEWFRGRWKPILEERLLSPESACPSFFRVEAMRRLIDEHASGREDHKRLLFSLLTFEIWHELFMDSGGKA